MTNIRILGPVQVADGDRLLPVGGPRQLKLLAFLVLHANRAVSSDALGDALWGSARAGADNRLQMAIARLRKALAPLSLTGDVVLRTVSGGYLLTTAPRALDAEVLADAVNEGRRALDAGEPGRAQEILRAGLRLWRGPPLAEVTFEDFAQSEIRRLTELRAVALEARIEADLQLGHHEQLIAELDTLLTEEPGRERFASQLMLALYRSSRQADALAVYHRTRRHLMEELGIEPGPELVALQEAILSHDPRLRWHPSDGVAAISEPPGRQPGSQERHNLPSVRTSFVDRTAELAAIERAMQTDRIITLTGVGGVGKSRLALEVAGRSPERWPDGVWLVELAAIGDPASVPEAVAGALGLEVRPDRSPLQEIAARLEERHLLLVLDNCEHVLDACADLAAHIARGRSASRVLSTSRAPLAVAGERLIPLAPLPVPAAERSDGVDLARLDAVKLFLHRAQEAWPEFSELGAAGELDAIGSVCRALDGIPLGIELAASRVRAMTPSEILAHLGDRLSLTGYERDREARHRDLESTIGWSYDLLQPRHQQVFRRLCLFAAPFTLAAAERVVAGEDVADAILALVDSSILSPAGRRRGSRYRLLETVREFGLRRLSRSGELPEAVRAQLDWAVDFVREAAAAAETQPRTEVLPYVEDEYRNLVRAGMSPGDPVTRVELVARLTELLFAGTTLRELRRLLDQALTDAAALNTPEVRLGRLWLSRTLRKLGELDGARSQLAAAADCATAAGDRVMAAAITAERALVEVKAGHAAEAQRWLAHYDGLGAIPERRVAAHRLLVEAQLRYDLLGELPEARRLYETCIAEVREHGPTAILIAALAALAELAVDLDDPDTVESCAREVLATADPVADAYSRGGAVLALGRAALRQGRPVEAIDWLAECARADIQRGSMETPETLETLACAVAEADRPLAAAQLLGGAAALRGRLGLEPLARERAHAEAALAAVQARVDEGETERALDSGRRLSERELLGLVSEAAPRPAAV